MKKIINFSKTLIYKSIYNIKLDKNIWIFSSTDNERYNYNSKYLFEYVLNNEKDIHPYFVINDDLLREKLKSEYGEDFFIETKTKSGIKKVLSGGVWFTSAGLPLYGLKLNKKRLIVNLWHGVPLKKIALMENKVSKLKKHYFNKIFSQNYSYILTTSKHLIPIMKESFNVEDEIIKVWGQPRNDCLFNNINKNKICDLFINLPEYEKLILYAPTYRDNKETRIFPFEDYNKNELERFLEESKTIIFIRTHLSESASVNKYLGKRVLLLNEDIIEDIMEILNVFDVLITDYSSIYIDFLLLNKPLLFLPYDKNEYLSKRGFNFEYDEVTPGYKPIDMKDFLMSIKTIFNGVDEFENDRQRINKYFNEVNTECLQNICEHIKQIIN
ncbi:CDP-glycerol glycerophosphotransferase family protein [Terrisporobacter vanillatitrophus]|uniref:CDP-glycerol glycerophosphotransferase family protein n=1 Tax=Terrisporobacter vanillatitrophus TaxID=3058402 RepID=UPI003366648E